MRVLVICEFSGVVRNAFRRLGHDAWSCDLLPSEDGSNYHYVQDIFDPYRQHPPLRNCGVWSRLLEMDWDLAVTHAPCTFLNHAGVRWLYKDGKRWIKDRAGKIISENPRDEKRWMEMRSGVDFFLALLNAPIPRIAAENSEMHPHALALVGRGPDQTIHPWEHGHPESKATCLWLKNLPLLKPTCIVSGREPRVHHASPGPNRWKERSRTLEGIARAMAEQWGCL